MENDALDDLRRLVIDDPALRGRLLSSPARQAFIDDVVDVAHEHGIDLSAEEVADALRTARRRSLERWV
jgi:hypothetical protein